MTENKLTIIGGGLAGCEAAWTAARLGVHVDLYEMRPHKMTEAHRTAMLAELICSNSLGSKLIDRATGLLNHELMLLKSMLVEVAGKTSVPAGNALAVDRALFASGVESRIQSHPRIRVIRQEVSQIPPGRPLVVASGPLTSPSLSNSLSELTGTDNLFFFDAIAPVILSDTINRDIVFKASRYQKDETAEGDYLNCPFSKNEYEFFVEALTQAERIPLKSFEEAINHGVKAGKGKFFEGCLPIEVLAARGKDSLAFGPMRPVGLKDPRSGKRPWAALQLRKEDADGTRYNMVGFQTNLKYSEQARVFRMIPGLENAVFERYGEMHRNTYLCAPSLLTSKLNLRSDSGIYIAGQLAGIEGYLGNIATGLVAGYNAAAALSGRQALDLPGTTMTGALIAAITTLGDPDRFQPVKANFGILPPLPNPAKTKTERARQHAERSLETFGKWMNGSFFGS